MTQKGSGMSGSAPLADIEHRRVRLLASVFLMLAAFSALSVAFSLLGTSLLPALQLTPTAARVGVLILTIGFIALVWEKERHLGMLSQTVARQEVLITAFSNRIQVIEELLEATDRLGIPLAIDDVMSVVLDAAVELGGAESASIELSEAAGEMAIARRRTTSDEESADRRVLIRLPLATQSRELGTLTLTMPDGATSVPRDMIDVIERFTAQAAVALEKALVLARERASVAYLEAANAVKAHFLTAVSHELRTPLTVIIGFASTLGSHWDELEDDVRRDFVDMIGENGQKLGNIVERLLEAVRAELQGVAVRPVLHDVRESVAEAMHPFLMEGEGDRIEFTIPRLPVEGEVDPFVVDQILTNLVDNALRHTAGRVRVAMEGFESTIVLRVSDHGPGIDPETLRVVSDPFYRTEEAEGSEHSGLHIVRMLVESHGGRGQIESDDRGTRAVFALPRFASLGSTSRLLEAIAPGTRELQFD